MAVGGGAVQLLLNLLVHQEGPQWVFYDDESSRMLEFSLHFNIIFRNNLIIVYIELYGEQDCN